jgi:hypothetical protein
MGRTYVQGTQIEDGGVDNADLAPGAVTLDKCITGFNTTAQWNANFIYNIPITEATTPLNNQVWMFDDSTNEMVLKTTSMGDVPLPPGLSGPMVFPMVWTETSINTNDWVLPGGVSDSEIGHVLAFPAKIRDATCWCKSVTAGMEFHLYLEDTNTMTLFTFPGSATPQTQSLNLLDIDVPAGTRIRVKGGDVGVKAAKIYINIILERVG